MKKITRKDLIKYVKKQPEDREINFSQSSSEDSCGCLMVHYFKDLGYKNFTCGVFSLRQLDTDEVKFVLNTSAGDLISGCVGYGGIKTYKELKEYLTSCNIKVQ